jgi:heparinase II/III-like protein
MLSRYLCAVLVLAAVSSTPSSVVLAAEQIPDLVISDFESLDGWRGLELDREIVKAGETSGLWNNMPERPTATISEFPHDWSCHTAVSFWMHSARKVDARFMLILRSENPESEGADYYSLKLRLDHWTGWKQFVVPLNEMSAARQPLGWDQIQRIDFTASGWDNEPHPEAEVRFDDFRLVAIDRVPGPRMSDEELFAAMDLAQPDMAAVKLAVDRGDLEAAKAAWLEHLRSRTKPIWTVDWRERPSRDRMAPAGGSPGWDYYSRGIRVDWTGWKHFRLTKKDFGINRQPIGWHWIDSIAINASGWAHEPDPETVLFFDDMRLVGAGKSIALGSFEDGTDEWAGLEVSKEQAKRGEASGKWDRQHLQTTIRTKAAPTDWTDVEALEFWCYAPKATGARLTMVLNSDRQDFAAAEKILEHVIQGHDFGPDIDWEADPNSYREWTYSINRFFHWRKLAGAYWESGEERFAKELCDQWLDWVQKNPVPLFTSGNSSYTWRTIECGIRQSTTWPDCLYRVMDSEHFTPEVAAVMTKSMIEHARHLMAWPSRGGNWLTMESNGLGTIGILLPEMKEASEWRETGLPRQYDELENQVYPDGSQIELTTGYHQVSLNNFLGLASTAILNDVPLPGDYHDKLRRMFEYNLYVQMPNGRTPALNDGGTSSVTRSMETALELYQDPLFDWAASRGTRGTPPDHASHYFPYAGQMVMRSSWEPDARYLIMDAGPYGFGHQHEDKLSLMMYAFGKVHLVDPGNYAYDGSDWRKYTIDTPAHNTVMVDSQPQRRRRCPRETYLVEEPPASNVWRTSERLDYAAGRYDKGYGDKNPIDVIHRREVLFVKPAYWLVVDTFQSDGAHRYDSLFHFDADEAEIDADGRTARTIDPTSNCLIAAAEQPGLNLNIIRGQTEPTVQGFIAGQRWRPSWKAPDADPPEHGKREIPTAVFTLEADGNAQLVYAVMPYPKDASPALEIASTRAQGGTQVKIRLPNGILDDITLGQTVRVTRTLPDGKSVLWASLETEP